MGLSHSPQIVTDGLVLHLDAGNRRSYPGTGTTWTDLSNLNNNASISGDPVFNTSSLGFFSLTSDFFNCSHNSSLNFTNNLTVGIICSADSVVDYASPFSKTSTWLWNDGFGIYQFTDNKIYFWINTWNAAHRVSIPKSTFNLTYLVCTYDGNNLKFYENGNLISVGSSYSLNINNSAESLYIGKGQDIGTTLNSYTWPGKIALTSIYNRALTENEVKQNFNALRGRYGI